MAPHFSLSLDTRMPPPPLPRRLSQECHRVEEHERSQYTLRNDTSSNRSKLIIAGKKLINAYDLLAGFCGGVRTIQLKRRFVGLTRQPAGDRLRLGGAGGDSPRLRRVPRDKAREKEGTNKNGRERRNE